MRSTSDGPPVPPAGSGAATFAARYCAHYRCAPRWFGLHVLYRTLPWHVVPFAPVLLMSGYFAPDRRLIADCAGATRLEQVHEEIRTCPYDPRNDNWLRRRWKLRISRRRLLALAWQCLATTTPTR